MYVTTEIRWFWPERPSETLLSWWAAACPSATPFQARTDVYVRPTDAALNVKLREGALEVKRRLRLDRRLRTDAFSGPLAVWGKWSFEIAGETTHPEGPWLAVRKTRALQRFVLREGAAEPVPPSADVETACALELATVEAQGTTWGSLCLEADGPEQQRAVVLLATAEHLAETIPVQLSADLAGGYPAWLIELASAPETRG